MREEVIRLTSRAQLLAVTSDHPFARLTSAEDPTLQAYAATGVAVWVGNGGHGRMVGALGDPDLATRVVGGLIARGMLPDARRITVPRIDHAVLRARLPVAEPDDWDFRWATGPPPAQPGQEHVVELGPSDGPAIRALLDEALPGSHTRPGDPRVRRWYGIREGGRLLACGADRSRGGVGSISGVAVSPGTQGRGLGTALAAAMAREIGRRYDVVTLGVMSDNHRASRVYQRLGFIHRDTRTSAELVPDR